MAKQASLGSVEMIALIREPEEAELLQRQRRPRKA
jgi:hypothetical protein